MKSSALWLLLATELWFILYQSRGPKRIRQLWSVALAPGLQGGGINSPGNVTRLQKFSQVVQSFWISFWCVLVFLLFSDSPASCFAALLRFAFSLFSVSHFKVFRYCCKYFVKNGIQSVSKMLLHQVCWQSQKLTLVEKGGGVTAAPSKINCKLAQVSGVYGRRDRPAGDSEKFFYYKSRQNIANAANVNRKPRQSNAPKWSFLVSNAL